MYVVKISFSELECILQWVLLYEFIGVKHHLLGTVSPDVEFTVKDFRNAAIPVSFASFHAFCTFLLSLLLKFFIRIDQSP